MIINTFFTINFFFFFIKSLDNLSYVYIKFNLLNFKNLKIFLSQLSHQNKKQKKSIMPLVSSSRVLKQFVKKKINFLNISEFVNNQQKEIYLKNLSNRKIFFLSQTLILKKKFFNSINLFILNKNINDYFLKTKNIGNIFFLQYRIFGLGFKIKKSSLLDLRTLRFEIGYGHGIYYILPNTIKCLRRKRRFFIFGTNLLELNFIKKHINQFKLLNPYKIRGLKDIKDIIKMKKGKKQSKK